MGNEQVLNNLDICMPRALKYFTSETPHTSVMTGDRRIEVKIIIAVRRNCYVNHIKLGIRKVVRSCGLFFEATSCSCKNLYLLLISYI